MKTRKTVRLSDYIECALCFKPMIGIMKISGSKTPRDVCYECGGKAIERDENGDVKH